MWDAGSLVGGLLGGFCVSSSTPSLGVIAVVSALLVAVACLLGLLCFVTGCVVGCLLSRQDLRGPAVGQAVRAARVIHPGAQWAVRQLLDYRQA